MRVIGALCLLALCAVMTFPLALGEAKGRGLFGWEADHGDLEIIRSPGEPLYVAHHHGSFAAPLWTAPVFVASWYLEQARRCFR